MKIAEQKIKTSENTILESSMLVQLHTLKGSVPNPKKTIHQNLCALKAKVAFWIHA